MAVYVDLPVFHKSQAAAYVTPYRFKALRCGRRWGKTKLEVAIAADGATKSESIGLFAPDYKILSETFEEIKEVLGPVIDTSSKTEGRIKTTTGGRVDFWSLENDRAGRSRKYHKALIDEGAFTKANMMGIWERSIRPTLLDYRGSALVASTPNGRNTENFFWRICNEPKHGFQEFHAPTASNPFISAEELEEIRLNSHPLVYQQEYLAEFVDWSGVQFFALHNLLDDAVAEDVLQGVEYPTRCDTVFAVIDTAVKSGQHHDATAVSFWSLQNNYRLGHPMVCLDWDIVQIDGALLVNWLSHVMARLEELANQVGARYGASGVHIEDKNSGTILLQQGRNRGWPVHEIDSKLTALGKDERAINVSGYVYKKMAKFSHVAYDKVAPFREQTKNHLVEQVVGYKVGDKDAYKRSDDLFDTFCYALSLGLGNSGGF